MQTLIFLLILFLISIFSVMLYFKGKKDRLFQLNSGKCPTCKQEAKTFFDKNTNTTFKTEIIKTRILKNHGCSGVTEVEYICKNCGLKEVHSLSNDSCGM